MSRTRGTWLPIAGGAVCALWALLAWIAVIPNQDILADGIQAQSLLLDPRIVLAFPGQKHGGPLEYPFTVAMEWLWPGNYYASSVIRIAFAFATGFLAAKLALRLFSETSTWALLAAMALGPTIIHGLQHPGVWWMQPNYDVAWMLVTAGALTLTYAPAAGTAEVASIRERALPFVAGLLFGLGIFAHPVIVIMAIPLGVLVVLVARPRLSSCGLAAAGILLGLVPAAISYFVNDEVNVWDPSHKPFIYPAWLWNVGRQVLGLDGIPDPAPTMLPYALGLSPTQTPFPGEVQSAIAWAVLLACLLVFGVGMYRAISERRWPSPGAALAASWLAAGATMVLFITSAGAVWHYSAGLAVLLWITIGALPRLSSSRMAGVAVTILALAGIAASTWGQNATYLSTLPERAHNKAQALADWQSTARALESRGAEAVFGSYYDAIPIGYVSNWSLRTVTNTYNRFPLIGTELEQPAYVVAVRQDGTSDESAAALEAVRSRCNVLESDVSLPAGDYLLARCPVGLLSNPPSPQTVQAPQGGA